MLGFWLAGCSGGGSGGGGFTTSVSGNAPLNSLSPNDQTTLCNDANAFVTRALVPPLCKTTGVVAAALVLSQNASATAADLQSACSAAQSDCSMPDGGVTTGMCDFSQFNSTQCTATVSDLTKCVNDLTAVEDNAVASLPNCNTLTPQNLTAAENNSSSSSPTNPQSCATLDSKCPGAMTGITGTAGH
jgi:hypothetical protein